MSERSDFYKDLAFKCAVQHLAGKSKIDPSQTPQSQLAPPGPGAAEITMVEFLAQEYYVMFMQNCTPANGWPDFPGDPSGAPAPGLNPQNVATLIAGIPGIGVAANTILQTILQGTKPGGGAPPAGGTPASPPASPPTGGASAASGS